MIKKLSIKVQWSVLYDYFKDVLVTLSKKLFVNAEVFVMMIDINTYYQTFVFIRYRRI
mgnify:CR=1 FL=1